MKQFIFSLLFLLMGLPTVLVAGCDREVREELPEGDAAYTEEAAMSIHCSDPEKALVMIDSAVIVGNITWQRGEYLKAVTQYGGLHNLPLARQTCRDLLEQEDAPSDSITWEDTYRLLTSIEYSSGNFPAVIRYATEASRMAHALDMPDEVGMMEGFIAQAMAQTGKTDEGIGRLQETLAELRRMNTFQGVVSYHSTAKKLLHILLDNQRFGEMVPVCETVLERIGELGSHPERFSGIDEGFDVADYVDFARGQTLAFLTIAYARQGDLKKARETEAEVFRARWSQSVDCDKMMSGAYHYMGQFDRFDQAMRRFENSYPDTVNPNYLVCLQQRSEAAEMQGHYAAALGYLQRATVIRDSLDRRQTRDQINELATLYHLQEERLARQQKEAEAERSRIVIVALTLGLLAAVGFLVWFFRQKRLVEKKNRVLAREIADAVAYKEKSTLPSPAPKGESEEAALFRRLSDTILHEKLYLDPQLDRQVLVDRFGLSKERIGAAFAKGSSYRSLIEFLNDCRLAYATRLLAERPDLSIAEVARESGFASADTLGRNFRQRYTLTPTQFRDQHSRDE